ncbi:MAG: CoA ester lyase [Sphingomonas sp.]|uniref:HpcH/HpaI aldolase/citrate lyase family protein n=1 Tax=Sphingomonas sp. TaxID=28214 RepID=UPI0018323C30|nr:CoA ester lyase [Sphingomonas sp.]MBA3667984.1 CoA ester lyase [Sphingomonas sp.]
MSAPRSWLFVPADSNRKMMKALASEADAIIFDLEDSVAPSQKSTARDLLGLLPDRRDGQPQRWVRINPLGTDAHNEDLDALDDFDLDGVVLPKTESGADVATLAGALAPRCLPIHAIVTETAASLFGLLSYRECGSSLVAMSWGAEDLSAALGASSKLGPDGEIAFTYRLARTLCLAGAAAAEVQPVDGVFADFRDEAGLAAEACAAASEGFTGKLAIHPAQVAPINAAFTPGPQEIDRARAIVDAFAAAPEAGVLSVDGKMVDRPHLTQAQRVLLRAR